MFIYMQPWKFGFDGNRLLTSVMDSDIKSVDDLLAKNATDVNYADFVNTLPSPSHPLYFSSSPSPFNYPHKPIYPINTSVIHDSMVSREGKTMCQSFYQVPTPSSLLPSLLSPSLPPSPFIPPSLSNLPAHLCSDHFKTLAQLAFGIGDQFIYFLSLERRLSTGPHTEATLPSLIHY